MATVHPSELPEGCRSIPNFPDYCVRPDGAVFSCFVYGSHARRRGPWWQMKGKDDGHGYLCFNLYREVGKPERRHLHQLVLLAFVGPLPSGLNALHRNDIRTDNRLPNLYYGTHAQNMADAINNGRVHLGEKRRRSRWKDEVVRAIRKAESDGMTRREIRERFGLTPREAYAILKDKIYRHL